MAAKDHIRSLAHKLQKPRAKGPGLMMPLACHRQPVLVPRPGTPWGRRLGPGGRQDRLKAVEEESRRLYADKLVDLANIVIGALGQLLSERGFSFRVTLMGLILFISGYLMSYLFLRTR